MAKTRRAIDRASRVWVIVGLALGATFAGFPVVWMISSSFKKNSEIFAYPPSLLTDGFSADAYLSILTDPEKLRFFANSYLVALSVTALTLVVAVLAAYAWLKHRLFGGAFEKGASTGQG